MPTHRTTQFARVCQQAILGPWHRTRTVKTVFKPHLVKDLTDVILPGIFENIRYVPIPRIEFSDPMVDAVIENLVIEGDNLAPNVSRVWLRQLLALGTQVRSRARTRTRSCSRFQVCRWILRDVSYYIKKKQGFPSITDKGVMDIFMGGSGFSFKVEMETADKAHVRTTHRHISLRSPRSSPTSRTLQIKLKKSNHKLALQHVQALSS